MREKMGEKRNQNPGSAPGQRAAEARRPAAEAAAERERQERAPQGAAAEAGGSSCCCGDGSADDGKSGGKRHTLRSEKDKKDLLVRLRRVEGQIRGIERMVEEDMYCPDILVQVSAATSALNSFNKVLLACHIRGCVKNDIESGRDETIDELCALLQKLMK